MSIGPDGSDDTGRVVPPPAPGWTTLPYGPPHTLVQIEQHLGRIVIALERIANSLPGARGGW